MKYKIVGNGSAFNYEMVNSSFIIDDDDNHILVDCGFSVFNELRRADSDKEIDLKKLTSVYITHLDDDHVGSLKALVYYQFFANKITTKIIAHENIVDELEGFFGIMFNSQVVNKEIVPASIIHLIPIEDSESFNTSSGLTLTPIETDHHVECYGVIFMKENGIDETDAIYISGDTKASTKIRTTIKELMNLKGNLKIFHDFSNWDCPENQVHACKSDVIEFYDSDMQKAITWYHNDAPFNSSWKTV